MAHYEDLDEVAKHALDICQDVRDADLGPQWHYSELARKCVAEPERMAQVILCLATWVPFESPPSTLADRAQAVTDSIAEQLHWRTA